MPLFFENELIQLRALEPSDVDLLYHWENDPELRASTTVLQPISREALCNYIRENHKSIYELGSLRLMIIRQEGKVEVGTIELYDYDPYNKRVAIGLLIGREYRQQGFARSAISLLSDYVLQDLRLRLIFAYIEVHNTPSQMAFSAAGFKRVAVLPAWSWNGHDYSDLAVFAKYAD
ncbi:hypothetical protein HQ45_08745 [Porphyromonas crevioricanis]|uniref:Pseudaminic acid biosynthesis N-acetyl transferase n=2 Tax=Porphyromonas crevioricanis TaxID=393921 RepID=A0A0A2FFF6_9PORP|nr:GNAT family N-acetyltransferase [Porphyromonas crevioricanis]KGN88770.1 hypothetical protein HQ45_08745 [Porphyromonas crevioricanis]KGN96463.1 hypothetical protein HQ38_01390 [Porphyromonas crevioricanis]SJZ94326.1 diamine N-acetyltransferase [Porphyromonas crevioricanis]SQH73612.1 pseudaminic acid biosynthesis N-acetyl transferase [Porphyromonas crevioricanis]GAD05481.1 acetyltransferase, GNAT family [Porphyromonas crevioricanis JCM 15906]